MLFAIFQFALLSGMIALSLLIALKHYLPRQTTLVVTAMASRLAAAKRGRIFSWAGRRLENYLLRQTPGCASSEQCERCGGCASGQHTAAASSGQDVMQWVTVAEPPQ